MGNVLDLQARRQNKGASESHAGRFVVCAHCGERHPIIRLRGGEERCVTAFPDLERWFCRNRGCRAAWLAKQEP